MKDVIAKIGDTYTLVDLAGEYAFFTPALLVIVGRFEEDPAVSFVRGTGKEVIDIVNCRWPFFEGLERGFAGGSPVDWDTTLYMTPAENLAEITEFMSQIAAVDRDTNSYWETVTHAVRIVDPTVARVRAADDPNTMVGITVFGLSTMTALHYIQPALSPPHDLAKPATAAPRPEVITAGRALLGLEGG